MVRRGSLLAALLVALVLGGWGLWRWHHRDEAVLRRRFDALLRVASFESPASGLMAAAYATELSGWFTEDAEFNVPDVRGVSGRAEIRSLAFQARSRAQSLALSASDVELAVDGDVAWLQAWIRARLVRGREEDRSREPVELRWVRTAEGWRIASAARHEVIQRPEGL